MIHFCSVSLWHEILLEWQSPLPHRLMGSTAISQHSLFVSAKNCLKSHCKPSKFNGGGGGVRGPGPVNGVETPAWTSCGQVCYQGGAMPVRCTQIPLSSDESEPVASSLFANTSLIIEFNILNGSFPRDYRTLPQAQSFMSFNLSERFNNNSSNIRCLSLLSTEFRDANTQAPLEQMEMSICTRMLSASCGHSRCICSCGQNKNALLFKWNHSGVTGTSIPSKNALAKTN